MAENFKADPDYELEQKYEKFDRMFISVEKGDNGILQILTEESQGKRSRRPKALAGGECEQREALQADKCGDDGIMEPELRSKTAKSRADGGKMDFKKFLSTKPGSKADEKRRNASNS